MASGAMTPMGATARLVIAEDTAGEKFVIFDDGNGNVRSIGAQQGSVEDFEWLVGGCAAFHHLKVEGGEQ